MVGAEQINTSHIEPHDARGAGGRGALFRRDPDHIGRTAPVQVGAKLALFSLTLHGSNDFASNHEATDVGTSGFLDELLGQNVSIEPAKRLDHGFSGFLGLSQNHSHSL